MTTATIMNGKEEITLAELIESKFLKCSKCNKIYQDPKILPCLHTFCKTCIDDISHEVPVTTNQDNSVDRLQCPLCQSFIGIPEEGATAFPENPFLSNLLNIHEYKHPKERACDYCKFDGKKTSAEYLCLDCNDDMCSNCSDAHRRTKITRNHSVIPFKQIQNGLYDHDMRSHQARPCTKHGDQMDFFCEICEILICPQCKNEEHDSHKSIKFDDALPRYQRHINGLLEGIQGRIPSIADYVKYLKSYEISLKESKQKLTENLETQAKTLHQIIDNYKSEMLANISQKCEAEMSDLETKSNNLEIAGKSLQDNATYLQYLLHHGRSDEILTLHRQITFRLTQLANMQIDGITQKLKMGFSTGTNMEQNIKLLFGKLLLEHVPVSQKEAASALENGQLTVTTMLPPLKNSPEVVKTFDAEGSNDFKDVWPTGVSITQSDEVVTVDRDNKKVKVFDKNGNLTLEFVGKPDDKLGSPFDATVLKNGNIAVTDYETNEVKIFDVAGQYLSSISGHFKHPRGITTNSKGHIVVVDCGTLQLTVHDPKTGKLLQKIEAVDEKGSKVLVDPYCVAVTNNDNILVTDTAAPNIKIFSPCGKYLAKYGSYGTKQDQILQPYGICCDDYGYIFVADNQNHRIHVLLPDGSFCKYLLTKSDGLWHPMGLAITKNGHFLVTEALGKVRVFRYI
ncbi:tripartite motif-containing protein 3-like [Mytilus californianus]|uniref:tripartite motif-containing protein 3-like n=1 Tax=Mytilus californianus TaxID=6549 RepID=UPI002246821A|nr:tripartite motif-containing protein 3-like [Mytilus californianus]